MANLLLFDFFAFCFCFSMTTLLQLGIHVLHHCSLINKLKSSDLLFMAIKFQVHACTQLRGGLIQLLERYRLDLRYTIQFSTFIIIVLAFYMKI